MCQQHWGTETSCQLPSWSPWECFAVMNRITNGLRICFSVTWHRAGSPTSAALCAKVKVMKAATDELLFANDCAVWAHSGRHPVTYGVFCMCYKAPWPCSHSEKDTFSVLTKIWHCKNPPCITHRLGVSQGCLSSVLLWNWSLSARLAMLWVNYSAIYGEHAMKFAEETCWFCSHFMLQICLMATLLCQSTF